MDNKKFETLMYFLLKDASKFSFVEWLDDIGLTVDDYEKIKHHLQKTYNIELYL